MSRWLEPSKFVDYLERAGTYTWLYRNDREWLSQQMPPRQATTRSYRVNWEERDVELSALVRLLADRLKMKHGKPIKVTVTAIARESNELSLVQKHLSKLPKTAAALAEVAESRKEFAIRRIRWVVEYFHAKGIQPKRWELVRRAGLRPDIENLPEVAEEIVMSLQNLN